MYEELFKKYDAIKQYRELSKELKEKYNIHSTFKVMYTPKKDISVQVSVRSDLYEKLKEYATSIYGCNKRSVIIHDVVLLSKDKTNEIENEGLRDFHKVVIKVDRNFAKIIQHKLKTVQNSRATAMYWLNAQLEDFVKELENRG